MENLSIGILSGLANYDINLTSQRRLVLLHFKFLEEIYVLRDRARGVLNSAISGVSESLGMSGFEKAYSLFRVTECLGEYIKADRFFRTVWLFVLSWIIFSILGGNRGRMWK